MASTRPSAARGATRRRAGPRSASSRSAPPPRLGPAQPAARTVAAVQHAHQARRIHARVPAVELDRARRLGIHPMEDIPSCRSISPSRGRWWSATACADHGRRRPHAAEAGRKPRCCACASARWAAIRSPARSNPTPTTLDDIIAEMRSLAHLRAPGPADRPDESARWRRRSARAISDGQPRA
jgi:hypothetical protein